MMPPHQRVRTTMVSTAPASRMTRSIRSPHPVSPSSKESSRMRFEASLAKGRNL